MKIFKKIRRIISQYFETEFWYRWRTVSKPNAEIKRKAFENLNDTWNGDFSILNIIDDKVTHMLHNLRKYGNCARCYILPSDVVFYGTEDDIQFAWKKVIEEDPKQDRFFLGSIKVDKSESDSERKLFFLEKSEDATWWIISCTEEEIPLDSIPEKKRMRTFVGFKKGEVLTDWVKEYKYVNKTFLTKVDDIYNYKSLQKILDGLNISLNLLKDSIFATSCTHIEPEDIKNISKSLYKYAQGLKPSLRQLWEFRKKIRKLRDMDSDDLFDLEKEYTKEEYQKIYQGFEEMKRKLAHEIADYWVDHAYGWWD